MQSQCNKPTKQPNISTDNFLQMRLFFIMNLLHDLFLDRHVTKKVFIFEQTCCLSNPNSSIYDERRGGMRKSSHFRGCSPRMFCLMNHSKMFQMFRKVRLIFRDCVILNKREQTQDVFYFTVKSAPLRLQVSTSHLLWDQIVSAYTSRRETYF